MQIDTIRRLLVVSGIAALVGATMWAYKSVVILITDDQPDYWFELALVWFGLSILLLASALWLQVSRSRQVIILGGRRPSLEVPLPWPTGLTVTMRVYSAPHLS